MIHDFDSMTHSALMLGNSMSTVWFHKNWASSFKKLCVVVNASSLREGLAISAVHIIVEVYTIRKATYPANQPTIPTCALFFPCVSLEPFQLYPVKQTARRPPPYSSPGSPPAMLSHLARFPTLQPKDR